MKKNKLATAALLSKKFIAAAVFGLAATAMADNPLSTYHYLADPSAASDGDTFYVLTDVDDYSPQKDFNYDIVGLQAFSSQDMKNWTDHGMIFRSKREFGTYPNNTWASGIAVHKGRIYIVYPNGASGVGMISADDIAGPYRDPIKETHGVEYIAAHYGSSVIGGCDNIAHCFDPGIFIEEDGTGYVIFGGGENDQRKYGNNLDIIKFTDNNGKITVDKNSLKKISAPGSFEAPYIHKKGGTYYLSFNTLPQVIDYGMSNSITGPYTFVGTVIPAVWKVPDTQSTGGNNHQGFAEFKGKWYAVYHDRRLVTASEHPGSCTQQGECTANPNKENHRSVSIDELTWNGDKMNELAFTREGPKQIKNFDPYNTYKALTSSKQRNVRSRTDWTKGQAVKHVLTPLGTKTSWIRVSGIDFGKGAENLRIKAANVGENNKVEIRIGSETGTLAGSCSIAKTSGWQAYTDNDCAMSGLTGIVDQLFFVFKGAKDSTMGILEWEFQGSKREPEPQTPFGGKAAVIPGVIQMENFDEPGYGVGNDSYFENDEENHGDSDLRKDTGVDLYKKSNNRVVVGYNQKGEWLEYTVNVTKAGDYTMYAAVASDGGASFRLSLDGESIADSVIVPKAVKVEGDTAQNFDDYNKVKANVTLPAGEHILRFTVLADWFDVDYINFVAGKDADDSEPLPGEGTVEDPVINSGSETQDPEDTEAIAGNVSLQVSSAVTYDVFDLSGKTLATVNASNISDAANQWKMTAESQNVQGVFLIRNRVSGMVIQVRSTR